jgi:hypothetical protein
MLYLALLIAFVVALDWLGDSTEEWGLFLALVCVVAYFFVG